MAKSDEILEKLGKIDGNVENIKIDIHDLKLNNKDQWKSINKNSEKIAGIKAVSGFISGTVSLVILGIVSYFSKGTK